MSYFTRIWMEFLLPIEFPKKCQIQKEWQLNQIDLKTGTSSNFLKPNLNQLQA